MTSYQSSRRRLVTFRKESADPKKDPNKDDQISDTKASRRQHLRAYYVWLRPFLGRLVIVFLLAVFGMALEMIMPYATKYIIDDILLADRGSARFSLAEVAIMILAALTLGQVLEAIRQYLTTVLNARIIFRLRALLFERLIRLPLFKLADLKTGGIVSRLSTDIDNVTGLTQMAVISPGVALLKIIFTLIILLVMRWELALVAMAMLPLLAGASLLWVMKIRPIYRSMAKDRTDVDGRVAETFGGIRVVRSFRRERLEALAHALGHHTVIRKKVLANLMEILVDRAWNYFIPLVALIIIWVGGAMVLAGTATVGEIVAFQMYSGMLLYPVWRIILSMSATQRALASMERVFDILQADKEKPDRDQALVAPHEIQSISIDQLRFSYGDGPDVLHDINFEVKGGETIAFVGASGAGKTTMTDLIARFHDPQAGSIKLNGTDLRDYQLASYRSLLGIVQQDVFMFDGTLKENLIYGRPEATDAEIDQALELAQVKPFLADLPDGLDTIIGERGYKLSGGQRQRLSIARAIVADPAILILDEATSNLDSATELAIQKGIVNLFKDRTTFVIAHRLSTIRQADRIFVLAEGKIVETGTHDELAQKEGPYAKMLAEQRMTTSIGG